MSSILSRGYAQPGVLVPTTWVSDHLDDPTIRIIESNEDPLLYTAGHIPGAVEVDWTADLNDSLRRDYLDRNAFQALMSRIGATPDTTLIFYGDKNNWWATYAFWVFQLFGHHKAKIMGGGRLKWISFRRSLASLSLTPLALFSSIIWIAIPLSKTVWRRSWKPHFQPHLQNRLRLYRQTSYSRYSAEISLWVRGKG